MCRMTSSSLLDGSGVEPSAPQPARKQNLTCQTWSCLRFPGSQRSHHSFHPAPCPGHHHSWPASRCFPHVNKLPECPGISYLLWKLCKMAPGSSPPMLTLAGPCHLLWSKSQEQTRLEQRCAHTAGCQACPLLLPGALPLQCEQGQETGRRGNPANTLSRLRPQP